MKRILVPTDFSPVADNALNYALGIADAFKSELYLCHVFAFDRFNYNFDLPDDKQPYPVRLERKLKMTTQKFSEKIKQAGLTVHTMVEEESIFSLFGSKVNELKIDIIIMGSKGASGIEKVVFGTVAGTALNWAKVPVLVVPPQHPFRPLENIVLAKDNKEILQEVLSPLRQLALVFGAAVTILNAKSGTNKKGYKKNDHHLEGVKTTYREVTILNSINESINDFVDKEGCDLLCMVRREKGFFESIFKKSITKAQVYDSQVPLLVLPEKYKN
ncbi:MAG: universal stress protein [Bacteroidota bacterium]